MHYVHILTPHSNVNILLCKHVQKIKEKEKEEDQSMNGGWSGKGVKIKS